MPRPWAGLAHQEGFAPPPGLGPAAHGDAMRQVIPDDLQRFTDQMAVHQEANGQRLAEERAQRRRTAARLLASSDPSEREVRVEERLTNLQGAGPICVICQEPLDVDDRIAMLYCRHMFHLTCIDELSAHATQEGQEPQCPMCRSPVVISAHFTRAPVDATGDGQAQTEFATYTPVPASEESHTSFAIGAG